MYVYLFDSYNLIYLLQFMINFSNYKYRQVIYYNCLFIVNNSKIIITEKTNKFLTIQLIKCTVKFYYTWIYTAIIYF